MDKSDLKSRICGDPGLPVSNPTTSRWMIDPPFPELSNVQSKVLPTAVDVVIIGSGITAASVAEHLFKDWQLSGQLKGKTVLVLEARSLCSGATGRNGGHAKPMLWEAWGPLAQKIGKKRTEKVLEFQKRNVQALLQACQRGARREWAECREVEAVTLFLRGSDEMWGHAKSSAGRSKQQSSVLEDLRLWDTVEAKAEFGGIFDPIGAFTYPAAALSPFGFVTSTFSQMLSDFPGQMYLETDTPAVSIEFLEQPSHHGGCRPYRVKTPRGTVTARHIVHAANAFSSHLLPGLGSKMTGCRAHMTAQPGVSNLNSDRMIPRERSWGLLHSKGLDYMVQRLVTKSSESAYQHDGHLMLGGGQYCSAQNGSDQIGVWDDSETDVFTVAHLLGLLPASLIANGVQIEVHESNTPVSPLAKSSAWSGIIALTADTLPLVGRLGEEFSGRPELREQESWDMPGGFARPGEWISAGYNGDGMVYAWLCGSAVARMICGTAEVEITEEEAREHNQLPGRVSNWLPEDLLVSYNRLADCDISCSASASIEGYEQY